MSSDLPALIAGIAGGLISGREVSSLYDFSSAREIDPSLLPDLSYLRPFRPLLRESGVAVRPEKYQYPLGDGRHVEIAVTGSTFIVTIPGCARHFMGTIRGNSISLYDHQASMHHNFRIIGGEQDRDRA
ncbi:MAG: hypothetical protein OHK006_19960 [Thermodesulfovibrionales bacterium]